jgi:hypothetical protein
VVALICGGARLVIMIVACVLSLAGMTFNCETYT